MSKSKRKLRRQLVAAKKQIQEFSMDSNSNISPSGGWDNPFNGFGSATDPTFSTIFLPPYEFTFNELTAMYQNPLMYRITNLHASDGTRKGFKLASKDRAEEARDMKKEMDDEYNWLALGAKMIACRHQYGGGVLFADIEDGRDPEEPINENAVKRVYSFRPIENWYAHPVSSRPLFGDEKPGQPMHYHITIQAWGQSDSFTCHESRLIRFPSFESDDVISQNERVRRRTWPFSTTQRVYDSIKRYGIGMQSESQLLQGFVEDVFKVKNLGKYKDLAGLREYIQEQRLLRSSMKATVMGSDDELVKLATPTTGIQEITADQRRDIGMTSEIPVPILFSEESGGLGGSTLSESREVWNDSVESRQNNQYTPMFLRMLEIKSYETGWDIKDINLLWNDLNAPTEAERVTMRKDQSETDKNYYEIGLPAENILRSRFGNEEVDLDAMDFDPDTFEKELEEIEEATAEEEKRQFDIINAVDEPAEKEEKESSEDEKEKQDITIVNLPPSGISSDELEKLNEKIDNIKQPDLKPVQEKLEKISEEIKNTDKNITLELKTDE